MPQMHQSPFSQECEDFLQIKQFRHTNAVKPEQFGDLGGCALAVSEHQSILKPHILA